MYCLRSIPPDQNKDTSDIYRSMILLYHRSESVFMGFLTLIKALFRMEPLSLTR